MKKTRQTSGGEQQRPHPDDEAAMHQRLLQWFVPGVDDADADAGSRR
jgi:hypothetical protein